MIQVSLQQNVPLEGHHLVISVHLQFQPHEFSSIITQIVEQDDIEARFEQEIVVQEFGDNSNVSNIDEVSQFNVDTVQSIEDLLIGTNSESSNDEIPTTSQIFLSLLCLEKV